MLIGLWLLLAGQRSLDGEWRARGRRRPGRCPDRLAPASAPIEPRSGGRAPRVAASGAVAARVRPAPLQRRANDLVECRSPGLPAEDLAGPLGAGDEDGRVAGPSRTHRVRDLVADEPSGRVEHLADAEAAGRCRGCRRAAVSVRAVARRGRLEREQVRVGEVRDVDVVADAGPVGRGVVVAEDRQRPARPRRRRGRSGSGGSRGRGPRRARSVAPGDVEVAQRHAAQPVRPAVPARARPRTCASSRRTG